MKTALFTLMMVFGSYASALEIQGARLNMEKQVVELDVVYGGGCKEHTFELKLKNMCNRMMPATCVAELVDLTIDDSCRALISKTVEVPAAPVLDLINVGTLVILDSHQNAAELSLLEI